MQKLTASCKRKKLLSKLMQLQKKFVATHCVIKKKLKLKLTIMLCVLNKIPCNMQMICWHTWVITCNLHCKVYPTIVVVSWQNKDI